MHRQMPVRVGGEMRTYHLFIPSGCNESAMPVVLHFAGFGQVRNTSDVTQLLGWRGVAESSCVAVVLPIGTEEVINGQLATSWNAAGCSGVGTSWCYSSMGRVSPFCARRSCATCGPCSWCACTDDISYVEAILDSLRHRPFHVTEVYASGFSNGAMMVYELSYSRLASRFRALVAAAGLPTRDWIFSTPRTAEIPPPVLHVHGEDDRVIPMDGNAFHLYTPMDHAIEDLLAHRGCMRVGQRLITPAPVSERMTGKFSHSLAAELSAGTTSAPLSCSDTRAPLASCISRVVRCVFARMEHTWSSHHVTLAWRFFEQERVAKGSAELSRDIVVPSSRFLPRAHTLHTGRS